MAEQGTPKWNDGDIHPVSKMKWRADIGHFVGRDQTPPTPSEQREIFAAGNAARVISPEEEAQLNRASQTRQSNDVAREAYAREHGDAKAEARFPKPYAGAMRAQGAPPPPAPPPPPPIDFYPASNAPITKTGFDLDLKTNLEHLIGNSDQIINNIFDATGNPVAVRSHFFNVLSKWESSLPLNQLWCIVFNIPTAIQDSVSYVKGPHDPVGGVEGYAGIDVPGKFDTSSKGKRVQKQGRTVTYGMEGWGEEINASWGVDMARKHVHAPPMYRSQIGCAFAQTVGIPPENLGTETVGIPQRGFIKAPVIKQRNPFGSLNIEFLETNVSFVDFLIRPWVIQASHYGLVARQDPGLNIKTDMFLMNFGRLGTDTTGATEGQEGRESKNMRGFVLRKMFHFRDCFPINVATERYSYTPENGPDRRDVEFVFTRYQAILPEGPVKHALDISKFDSAMIGAKSRQLPMKSKRPRGGIFGIPGRIAGGIVNSGRNLLGL